MDGNYYLGVSLAVFSGILINGGLLFQKKVINEIPKEAHEKRFIRTLIRHPLWVAGFILEYICGAITFMLAQNYIGPALVPGLMATGYIVLVIGSIQILGERLNRLEYMGIALLIVGVFLVGLSALEIDDDTVRNGLDDSDTVFRIIIFSTVMTALWILTHIAALRSKRRKGVIMGLSNGFAFGLSNFWIAPLTATILIVLGWKGTPVQIIMFVAACIILIVTNVLAIRQIQEAFKFANAHNIIPMQQIPVQIAPVLYYFSVFSLNPPSGKSVVYIVSSVLLIIVSGFLLSRRQEELEQIH